ncbi:MMPL family transporter [bacterium]|nr:MMPL family transporter [bacterium]
MSNDAIKSPWIKKFTITWSAPITIVLGVLALVGFYLGLGVQLKLSLTDLLPDNHPAVVKFNKLTEIVGGVGFFAIVLDAQDAKSHLEVAPKIIEELKKTPLLRSSSFHREQRFFEDHMLYYMDVEKLRELDRNIEKEIKVSKKKVFDLGLFDDEKKTEEPAAFNQDLTARAKKSAETTPYLTSPDGKNLLIMAKPSFDSTDLKKTAELIAYCEKILKDILPAGVTYRFGERYYNKVLETEMIQGDISRLGLLSISLIMLVLLLYIRSFRAMAVIFIPVFMGLGITMGATRLFIGHINIITGFLVGILSGLGVDYSVHLFLRLRLERREPSSNEPDIFWRTISSTGHSIFVGAAAAAFTFFLLSFSSFRAFSEFGFVCGTGIAAVFICLLLSFSCLARFFRADTLPVPPPLFKNFEFPMIPVPKGFVVACVITGAIMVMASQVGFQYDFEKMMKHSTEMEEVAHLIDKVYGRSAVPSAIAADTKEEALAIEKSIREKYIPALVTDVISGASIVPENQAEKATVMAHMRTTLKPIKDRWIEKVLGVPGEGVRRWVNANPFTFTDIPEHLQDALRGQNNKGYLLYVYPAVSMSHYDGVSAFAGMLRAVEKEFPNALTGSDAVVFSDILDLIKRDGSVILVMIFLSVGFFIWLNTRRMGDTIASYVPLLLAFVVGMGLMAIFGVQFNILNITIIPSFVALGIDVPIHLVHRARETRSGFKAARDLAPGINLAMGTSVIGFGILIFARAGVLKSLGDIATVGTLAIWWVGLFMLASALEWSYRRKAAKGQSPDSGSEEREPTAGLEELPGVTPDRSLQMKN